MKKKRKLKLLDVIIVAVCILGFAWSLKLFWEDLNSSSVRSDKKQIATIYYKRKIAQRKYDDRVVWERLQQNSPLYNADSVKTADDAEAEIHFQNDAVVKINENTTLQIFYSEDGFSVAVGSGKIAVDTTSSDESINVKMDNGSVVKVESGSKAESNKDDSSGSSGFIIQAGSASISKENGAVQKISKGEAVSISETGEVKNEVLSVTSINSNLRILNFDEKPKEVLLQWDKSAEIENKSVRVEVSKDKNFKSVLQTFDVKDKNFVNVKADNGKIYWRVYPADNVEKKVQGKIVVEEVKPVKISNPGEKSVYKYREKNPEINFNWKGNEFAEHYNLEVFKSDNLKEPVLITEVTENNYKTTKLEEGDYKWRVTPFYKNEEEGKNPTELSRFSIEKEEILPPALVLPAEKTKISLTENEEDLKFVWKSYAENMNNTLLVSKNADFSDLVMEKPLGKALYYSEKISLNKFPEGEYFWKVIRTSSEEKEPSSSESRSFNIKKYIPGQNKLVYPPENFLVEKQKLPKVEFMWKLAKENMGNESIFQVSSYSDFQEILVEEKNSDVDFKNLSLDKGDYYWRIRANGVYSDSRKFTVLGSLGGTKITYPKQEIPVTIYDSKVLDVNWENNPEADYYKLKLYNSSGNLLAEDSSVKNHYAFSIPDSQVVEKLSSYKVSVQPVASETENSDLRYGEISTLTFNLRAPVYAKLSSPDDGSVFDGLKALRKPVSFEWQKGDEIYNSEFVLKKRLANGTVQIVRTIKNPKEKINIDRLSSGTYEWGITGKDKDNHEIGSKILNSFTVTPVPLLDKPVQMEPKHKFVIGPDYLKKNRKVNFKWTPVKNASEYDFVLYHRRNDGTIKKILQLSQKNCEVQIMNLALLDLGNFEWQVQAFNKSGDGFVEQKSPVSYSSFDIDFKLPGKVKTNDPGRLYAN